MGRDEYKSCCAARGRRLADRKAKKGVASLVASKNVNTPDWIVIVLVIEYAVASVLYAWHNEWAKAAYWLGAGILTMALLWIR